MYLDAAVDRRTRDVERDFDAMVEATRIGTVFAHDRKQYEHWKRASKKRRPRGLTGAALEGAIAAFAMSNPEYIAYGARA